jgi:hypothetical protein
MKHITLLILGAIVSLLFAGCSTLPQARVVRLALNQESGQWRCSVNGSNISTVANPELTNRLAQLQAHHGDLVLFGTVPIREPDTAEIWAWLSRWCEANQVNAYHWLATPKGDIFSTPVYHWTAPFENPMALDRASFFYEGRLLGSGKEGYKKMVQRIESTYPHQIFILGSLFDRSLNFGPGMAPYERDEQPLNDVLTRTHTETFLPHPLNGF